jgi:hypothetical protein
VFRKKTKKYEAIKLYSVGTDQAVINRKILIESIFTVFENAFKEFPEDYDISGPYGIRKGSSVKLKTFKNKLEKIGHEKYYGYHGYTDGQFGFNALFNAKLNDSNSYTELIIWYDSNLWTVDFKQIASTLFKPLSVSSGYQICIEEGHHIVSESKIKKGLFGGMSISVSYECISWLHELHNGAFRSLYKYNLWNEKQLENALSQNLRIRSTPMEHLYYVEGDA